MAHSSVQSKKTAASVGAIAAAIALVACMIAGCDHRPAGARETTPSPHWFEDVANTSGLSFEHESGHSGRYLMPEIMGGGVALFDMDNDGDLDAYLVQSGYTLDSPPAKPADIPPNRLYRNRGDGTFDDVTIGSGADLRGRGYGMGVATGDYDNDGDVDLHVTNVGPNVLLRNDGGGRFTDVTPQAGVGDPGWGTSAAFVDIDRDGDLDLFVCNYLDWSPHRELDCSLPGGADYCSPKSYKAPVPDVLYRNNGDATFTDISQSAGIRAAVGTGLGVVCGDLNDDGLVDLFVANDGMSNHLWINIDGTRFEDRALAMGCAVDMQGIRKAGMGVTMADIDDDLDIDMLVCNMNAETDSLYRNHGEYFQDATAELGLAGATKVFTRFGVAWVDLDNDGYLDLYEANGRVARKTQRYTDDPYAEPNMLFRGSAGGRLSEVSPRGGTRELMSHTSRGAAFGDIDNDGGVDIVVVNRDGPTYLLRNVVPNRGHWIMMRVLDEHGRDAIGAKVTMSIGDRSVRRDVRTAYSYCAANDPRIHVGLGAALAARDVTVTWVDGTTESFGDFAAGQIVTVRRGEGAAR
jgi:hypothetical protein